VWGGAEHGGGQTRGGSKTLLSRRTLSGVSFSRIETLQRNRLRLTGPRLYDEIARTVSYVLPGGQFGIDPLYVVLGIRPKERRGPIPFGHVRWPRIEISDSRTIPPFMRYSSSVKNMRGRTQQEC
jgi:hypothetical protein